MSTAAPAGTAPVVASYVTDYDAITAVMNTYNEAVRMGKSAVMRASFHPAATFFGHYKGKLFAGPCQILFDWVDGNGPTPDVRIIQASVEIHNTIATVRLEMENLKGKLSVPEGGTLRTCFNSSRLMVSGRFRKNHSIGIEDSLKISGSFCGAFICAGLPLPAVLYRETRPSSPLLQLESAGTKGRVCAHAFARRLGRGLRTKRGFRPR
jgi:hypothetical protein